MKKTKLCAFALAAVLSLPSVVCSVSASAETWATNFKGIVTETEDDFVYKNYYINKNEWLIGDNVMFPKYNPEVEKDYIRFLTCTNRSLFGPRVRYEDFVCRFTVIVNNVDLSGIGASLGLSFNRKTLYSYANDCDGILFMRSADGTAVRVTQGDLDKAETGTIWLQYQEENSIDLWSKNGGKYDFMVVKSGDEAQLYYAEAGDEEGLKILRATVSGVRGEGFVAMCGIMGANFHLDNFGVWDLNDVTQPFSAYTKDGAVGFCDGKAVLGHGGSLVSKDAYADASASYNVKLTSGNSFSLTVGDQLVCFSSDGSVTGSKGLVAERSGSVDFSAFEKGAAIRLRKLGEKLYVDVDSGDGYAMRAIFNGIDDGTAKFGVKSGADATLIVDTPAIVSLNGKVEIATRDYDPKLDVDPIGPKDVSFDEYYRG